MTIRPYAEIWADFPSDSIEEGGQIVLFGGRGITKALIEITQRMGHPTSDIRYAGDHGWEFDLLDGQERIWFQISELGDRYYLITEASKHSRKGRAQSFYCAFLQRFAEELRQDKRFRQIYWYTPDLFTVEGAGLDTPVDDTGPNPKPGLLKRLGRWF